MRNRDPAAQGDAVAINSSPAPAIGTESSAPSTSGRVATGAYPYYVLAVLIVLGLFAWIDRQILSIVLQSVKVEFSLTDTQLGLIGGVAFGLFYVTVALPVAWLADRLNRRVIIAASVALWSVMTALCGLTGGFWSLFLARMGVGIGEAGVSAPSQSMLADYFPPHRRGVVMGVLYSYVPLSYLVSYGFGGWLNEAFGWRTAFIIFGLPGLLLAALVHVTVREPPRAEAIAMGRSRVGSFPAALGNVTRLATLRRLSLAGACHALGMVAASVWLPAFFIRVHHMSSSAIGMRLALILGLGGLIGTFTGGQLADRARRRDERWYLWFCSLAVVSAVPFIVAMYLTRDASAALLLYIVPAILNHTVLGPTFASVQNISGGRHRALGVAFYLFAVNLISMGMGPLLIGYLSDLFHARYGNDGLRYSLLYVTSTASVCSGLFYFVSARSLTRDRDRLNTAAALTAVSAAASPVAGS